MNLDEVNTNTEEEDNDTEEVTTDARESATSEPNEVPSPEELKELCGDIKANFNANVAVKPVEFRFKTVKEKDEDGNEIETKRAPVSLPIPVPTVQGVIDILEKGGKELELLLDTVETVIVQTARGMISDDLTLNARNFPVDKLSWEAIANMPKAERSGGGIAKEVWEDFGKDYIKVMPEVTGKSVEQVTNASKLLVNKFAACKTNFPVLEMLTEQLGIYVNTSDRAEEFASCVEFLVDKANKLVNQTEEDLLGNL